MTPLVIWASRPIPEPFVERLAEHRLIVGGVDAIPDDVDAMVAAARPNFGEEFMRAHPQLRVIARTGTGFDSAVALATDLEQVVSSTTKALGL